VNRKSMKIVGAVLASSLLALAGLSGVAAHGPGHGGGGPVVGSSARPLPSGWVWPSDDPNQHPVKSHNPQPSKSPEASRPPKVKPPVNCTPVVTPTPSATPIPANLFKTSAFGFGKDEGRGLGIWQQRIGVFQHQIDRSLTKVYCAQIPLLKTLDAQIAGRIKSLQQEIKQIDASGLGTSDKATVDAELNSLITDLQAFKTKVDAETTLAALQADYQTLKAKGALYRTVGLWVDEIVGAEKLIASESKLTALEATIAADIAAAPAGPEKIDAQIFLDDMKAALTNGETLVAPLPAQLLAITPAQLADGSAMVTLASVKVQLSMAKWDFMLAGWAGKWAEMELKEASATPKPTATPTVNPSPI
jgi:hypothetical protein